MVILDLQDFMRSKYYDGTSILNTVQDLKHMYLTFKIPLCNYSNKYVLRNTRFFITDKLDTYPPQSLILMYYKDTKKYFPHTYSLEYKGWPNLRDICLGQARKPIATEIKKIYRGEGGRLISIAMLVESILNRNSLLS